jgi:hypothetical protein
VNFPGFGDRVVVPHAADIAFTGSASYTVSAWVHVPSGQWGSKGLFVKSYDRPPYYGLWIDSKKKWIYSAGGEKITGPAAESGWRHVALVQDAGSRKRHLYIDGALKKSGNAKTSNGTGDLVFGRASTFEDFNGKIDEVKIFNRALSSSEIGALAD